MSTRRPRRWLPTVGRSWHNLSAAGGSTRLRCATGNPPRPTRPAKTRWPEGVLLRVAFITVGDTGRKTGGYLYNGRVISGLRQRGFEIEEVVAGGASPEEQRTAALRLESAFDPSRFDTIVVDALARIAVSRHLDLWLSWRPVVALVHELPSVAGGGSRHETVTSVWTYEEPQLPADRLVAVSDHGREVLLGRGISPRRIHVVPPGFDGVPVSGGSH